mgnify:FL=1
MDATRSKEVMNLLQTNDNNLLMYAARFLPNEEHATSSHVCIYLCELAFSFTIVV